MEGKDKNEIKNMKSADEPNLQEVSKSIDPAEKEETTVKRDNYGLKNEVMEDGGALERVFSENETSNFETISFLDSKDDFEDLDLSSSINGDYFNVIVETENELIFQNSKKSNERVYYRKKRSNSFCSYKNRSECFLSDKKSRRNDGFKNFREQKYGRNKNCVDMNFKNGRDKKFNEKEEFSRSRWDSPISRNRNKSTSRNSRTRSTSRSRSRTISRSRSRTRSSNRTRSRSRSRSWSRNRRRSRRNKRNTRESRSRHSRSSEYTNRSRSSRSLERNIKSKTPSFKGRKTEAELSECFDNDSSKSYSKRNSGSSKKTICHSFPLWNRLSDNRLSSNRIKKKKNINEKNVRNSWKNGFRKKERTPFLVELERKLKEANSLKNFTEEATKGSLVPVPEHSSVSQNSSLLLSTFAPPGPITQKKVFYPFQYPAMPMFSVDNLPLVPGPTGLPVHITVTGEQILHDMDGRRIPVGPNGFYLPVDPTGRLFPHIVSPGNQAVPVHLTEDGVLRLPNSEPVPYGPGHQLPVNIDGSIILIGPDSKPLYPYPNLPKEPPAQLQMMGSSGAGHMASQQAALVVSEITQTVNHKSFVMEPPRTQSTSQFNVCQFDSIQNKPFKTDFGLAEFLKNSSGRINKANLIKKYEEKVQERNEDALKCVENKKNFNINPSKGGVKRSIPMKLLPKKTFKNNSCTSGSDIVLDSADSDSVSSSKCILEPNKDVIEEIILSSDDDLDILKIVYDSRDQMKKAKGEDPIIKKVQRAIKSLCDKNYKPPVFGRFIITNLITEPVVKKSLNESPLVRNRIQLPFLTPKAKDVPLKNQSIIEEKTAVTFKFLPQKNTFEKGEKPVNFKLNKINSEHCDGEKFSVYTVDFSMQCDFTSVIIKNLSSKISNLEMEVTRLRNVNENLLDGYRNVQAMNQKKNDQLRKAALEIEEKNNEIQTLKRSLEKRQ